MNVTYPPNRVRPGPLAKTVFLAGAIDNGKAVDWQKEVTDRFSNAIDLHFYNPRRPDWDWELKQTWSEPRFAEQVEWELDKIDESDFVFMHFPEKAVAPVSMLEFGYIIAKFPEKLIVSAHPGFWRRGNLEIVCRRQRVLLHPNLEDAYIDLWGRMRPDALW